ncbi:unnamed protein product [Paramecium sonneborni]|uniref:Uncharacterized protein n=1 Tax=Paramecium sonneborni TaxID=65129 RepID=A0A8S1N782_9CILI|nr:unnamed protein product [Paramecium sonneborni]
MKNLNQSILFINQQIRNQQKLLQSKQQVEKNKFAASLEMQLINNNLAKIFFPLIKQIYK